MENQVLFRLGSQDQPWTQAQIDDFMERMENEMFDGDRRRGTGGSITEITREDAEGNETTYVKEDGIWSEE
jgi:hypothetical protein